MPKEIEIKFSSDVETIRVFSDVLKLASEHREDDASQDDHTRATWIEEELGEIRGEISSGNLNRTRITQIASICINWLVKLYKE